MDKHQDRIQLIKAASASIISAFGATTFSFALSLKLLQTTGSAFGYGTSLFVGPIVGLIIAPLVGKIIDRYSKKKIATSAEIFLILLLLTYFFVYSYENQKFIYANAIILVCLINIAARFFNLSFLSAIPQIVSKKRRQRLNSLQTTGVAVSNIIAAPVAGFLFGNIDFKLLISLQIITEIVTLLITLTISFNFMSNIDDLSTSDSGNENSQNNLSTFRVLKNNNNLLSILITAMVLNIANVSLQIGVPFVVINELHHSATISGNVQGLFSLGVLIGGITISSLTLKNVLVFTKRVYWIFAVLLLFVGVLLTLIPQYSLAIFMIFELLLGIANTIADPPMFTYIQNTVPNQVLGRINTFVYTMVQILNPVGVLLYSFMFSVMDYTWVYLINGIVVIGLVYLTMAVLGKKKQENNYE